MRKKFSAVMVPIIVALLMLTAVSPALAGKAREKERYAVRTADGVELVLKRYRPDQTAGFRKGRQPVIVSPGILSNFNCLYLSTPEGEHYDVKLPSHLAPWAKKDKYIESDPIKYYSLAHFLWNQGYDVWLFNYRGEGREEYTSGGAGGYSIDDLGIYDMPAAVEKVYEVTRKHPVWCSHSMGSTMAYIYLQGAKYSNGPHSRVVSDPALAAERNGGQGKQSLKGFIDLDGPMGTEGGATFDCSLWWQALSYPYYLDMRGIMLLLADLAVPPAICFEKAIWWLFAALGFPNLGIPNLALSINPDNMDAEVMRYAAKYAVDGVSTHTLSQFQDAHTCRKFREYYLNGVSNPGDYSPPAPKPGDGYYYYSDNLAKINLPALVIADDTQDITMPEDIRNFYLGKSRHRLDAFYRIPGTAHVDLIMGLNAPTELFPKIGSWLRKLCRNKPC
jgi:hypothetical protein